MRGTGTVISKSAVDDRDGEADINRNINASKPIFVDTDRVGSVQNAIGTYGTNISGGTLQLFDVINTIQTSIQDVTGVNEAMTGTQGASDALVGVVQAQIQRGSLVQEPFYWGLTSILRAAYEHMATVGKAIYHDNPRKLAIMVGDKGLQNITITKDHLLQDYRIFINRSEPREQGIANGNQLLFTLLQSGMIDQQIFANLFNRANPELIANSIREHYRAVKQAESMANKAKMEGQQAGIEDMQAQAQMMQEQQAQAQQGEMDMEQMKHQQEMEKVALKEGAKTERDLIKNQSMQ
jgi:hypothetical protein